MIFGQVTPSSKPHHVEKVEPVTQPVAPQPQVETTKVTDTAQSIPAKIDYATDLFNMLSMDGPSENGSEAAGADDNNWAGFQCKFHMCVCVFFFSLNFFLEL